MRKPSLLSSAVIAALVALPSVILDPLMPEAQAQNGSVTFTLVNKTGRVLREFYASPPSTDDWEEDILGQDVLNPGESTEITIDDGREDCLYDFKGVFEAGNGVGAGSLIQSKVNVCDGGTYEYYGR